MALESEAGRMGDMGTQQLILVMFHTSQSIAWLSCLPYIYYMVVSFDGVRKEDVAFYVGLLFAATKFSTAVRASLWKGMIAEMGHKPVLLIGIVCSMVSVLCFGLSRSLGMMYLAVLFNGLFNPGWGAAAEIQKILDRRETEGGHASSRRGIVLTILTTFYSPFLGGILADPAARYRAIFHASFWKNYPYFLPNLVIAVANLFVFASTVFFFQETHPRHADRRDFGLKMVASIKSYLPRGSSDRRSASYTRLGDEEAPSSESTRPENSEFRETKSQHDIQHDATEADSRGMKPPRSDDRETVNVDEPQNVEKSQNVEKPNNIEPPNSDDKEAENIEETKAPGLWPHVLATAIFSFHKTAIVAITPVFLAMTFDPSSPLSTGFVYSPLTIASILHLQLLVAVAARSSMGPAKLFRSHFLTTYGLSLLAFPILYPVIPFLATIDRTISLVLVVLVLMTIAFCTSLVEACTTIKTNKLTSQTKIRTAVNMINGVLDISLGILGPVFAGLVFGLGLRDGNNAVLFWTVSGVSVLGAVVPLLS